MLGSLFDVQSGFGGARPGGPVVSLRECVEEMERLDFSGALVRLVPDDVEVDVLMANRALEDACAGESRLVPCPILLPATGGDVPPEAEQVDEAISGGARAATIRPSRDYWEPVSWVSDALFSAMERRRMPLLCAPRYVPLSQVDTIAERFPGLPIILAEVPYGCQRMLYPLMQRNPLVYLSLGENVTLHLGIEELVGRFGAGRLLFGTGFPRVEPMMAVTQLAYADISLEARNAIAHGNAEALLGGVGRAG